MADEFKRDIWARNIDLGPPINELADLLERTPRGAYRNAISDTFLGFDHRGLPNSIPINKDYYGMIFFTKPDMNMRASNIGRSRIHAPLLTPSELSYPRAFRCMLDARHMDHRNGEAFACPALVDPKQAFLPLLSNLVTNCGGWPDLEAPTYTSEPGVYGEEMSFVDGIASVYRTYDMTVNFRNIQGDPITALIYYWVMYAQMVFEGKLIPHTQNNVETAIDYATRIYRIVLDPTKRYVQKIACTGGSFPDRIPIGVAFNYENNGVFNSENREIGINFRCIGADYFDDIIIYDFNRTVMQSNSHMGNVFETKNPYVNESTRRANGLMKIPQEYLYLFNFNGYPFINVLTYELEWWVYLTEFQAMTGEKDGEDAETGEGFTEEG